MSRQLAHSRAISTGVVAAMVPSPPNPMMSPFRSGHRRRGNQRVMALKEAMRPPAKPTPMRPRPRVSTLNDWAAEKISAPQAATRRSPNWTRRGPYRSRRIPSGSWKSPKPRK